MRHRIGWTSGWILAALLVAASAFAVAPPDGGSPLADKAFRAPELYVSSQYTPAAELGPLATARLADLAALGIGGDLGFVDRRTGSWGTLMPAVPLVPGDGKGNALSWAALGEPAPATDDQLEEATWRAFAAYLAANAAALRIPAAELGPRTLTAAPGGEVVQINVRQAVGGVPVRDAFLTATVSHGNLVLMGTRNWGAVGVSTTPAVPEATAVAAAESYAASPFVGWWKEPALELVPVAVGDDPAMLAVGSGLGHKLVWAMGPMFAGENGSWEVLVDAHSGDVVAFADQNHYLIKSVRGGVFPLSNDGIGPEGTEQPGYPMPFADVTTDAGGFFFADSGGDLACVADGTGMRTHLNGRYVAINDNCGPIDEYAADPNDIDMGTSPGTDCAVPPGSSPGNTHSARTGFYEVNRIIEIAKGWLPDNAWLDSKLTANMNIDEDCNAFWNGSTINFYTSGGGCRNTGEIAAVFDHEWGHGMDANDANPSISSPGEAYADIASVLRLNDSCVGRGFDAADLPCGGNGDPCTVCSGVREVDWAKRQSGQPHDIDWILSPTFVGRGGCLGGIFIPTQQGPCGLGTHCEGSVASEAVWDLWKRDLPAFAGAGFALGDSTIQEMLTRIYYLGGGALGNWYNCNPAGLPGQRGDGCNADGAYLNFLALDDDNGDLSDGTPHMPAFHAAFDRHQMACGSPAPVTGATCTRPTTAPSVTAVPSHKGAELSWNAVPGASEYWVYRGDGVLACEFGKERIAEVTGTSYVDAGAAHDREVSYLVIPVGSSDSCLGPASACTQVTPQDGTNMVFTEDEPSLAISGGDGDVFIDNCETGTVTFSVRNDGTAGLTNVRVAHVEPVSHPEIEITSTPMFASSLAACGEANGTFEFVAAGLSFNDTVVFRIDVTADEIAPAVVSTEARFVAAESDFAPVTSRTWSFPDDLEDWQLQQGTFAHNPGLGGNATLGYLESSKLQDDTCDQVASPLLRLTASSTLSLYNQFAIEPGDPNVLGFYDRANVGLQDVAAGTRTPVSPDGGRTYNASGPNGACVTAGQPGWAGPGPGFLESTWSAGALNPGGSFTGKVVRLDVAYGTDPLFSLDGIQFDEVTLTDFEEQVPDAQDDDCGDDPDDPDPQVCGDFDDSDAAVEYKRGWHRRSHAAASNGGYHRRMGGGGGAAPTARVAFTGDEITYHYVMSDIGGTADVYLDGSLVETLSYGSGLAGPENPTFGHSRTYSGLGDGSHELVVEHRGGAVYVDGFEVPCPEEGDGADASAATAHSVTTVDSASSTEGSVIVRTVEVGSLDEHVSVVVEGSLVPLTVRLLDPVGNLLASGDALVSGLAVSGVDAVPAGPGTYRIEIVNALGAFRTIQISTARTVSSP